MLFATKVAEEVEEMMRFFNNFVVVIVLVAAVAAVAGCDDGGPLRPDPLPPPGQPPPPEQPPPNIWDGPPIVPFSCPVFESPDGGKVVLTCQKISPASGMSIVPGKEFGIWLVGSYRNSEGKALQVKSFRASSVGGPDEPSAILDAEGARGWSHEGESKSLHLLFRAGAAGESIPILRLKGCYSNAVCDFRNPQKIAWSYDIAVNWP